MLAFQHPDAAANWLRQHVSGTLQTDSRRLRPGDGFFAWPGAAHDAREYVPAALAAGAGACLVEGDGAQDFDLRGVGVAAYAGLKAASGPIAASFFAQPSKRLALLAVTGTNGKTSSAWWLAQALSNLKLVAPISCAMVGTLGIGRVPSPGVADACDNGLGELLCTGLTTPDPVLLQQTLARFADSGVQACTIEVSSIGLEEGRLNGSHIRSAIFTNLTQDHLDYHGSMAAYGAAKARLFRWPGLQSAVINIDDQAGAALAESLAGQGPELWTVSCLGPARLQARHIRYEAAGLKFEVLEREASGGAPSGSVLALQTRLIGTYNVANLLGVIAAMRSLGVPLAAALASCADLSPVPGRMQCLGTPGQPLVAVDYAHTPDALAKALQALRPLTDQRGGQLWCVFGCGGDRDSAKRPLMGAIAASQADRLLVTSDNPRSEQADAIISQILLGVGGDAALQVEPDRARAIAFALAQAGANDVLLIAGKGHEDYQEIAGQRRAFSDIGEVRRALASWHPSGPHKGAAHA